ncbi:40S ribosomal S7 [Tubulinosema ratisbonensis]|uniref:40S ribosomal S7 n=1 Tax=Tubulinosema ratisbonensis TaxID=291195 RepID=A0A437AM22_9MICR|nr:40S ribosomal S7 [Tubulinosema ratisbonensis]
MSKQTDHEQIISQEISKQYNNMLTQESLDALDNLKIQLVPRDSGKNILLIKVDSEVLNTIQQKPHKIQLKLRAMFPDVISFLVRDSEETDSKTNEKIVSSNKRQKVFESWAKDLCTPAMYEMRTTTVLTSGEKFDTAYISNVSEMDDDHLLAMQNAYHFLTGLTLKYQRYIN